MRLKDFLKQFENEDPEMEIGLDDQGYFNDNPVLTKQFVNRIVFQAVGEPVLTENSNDIEDGCVLKVLVIEFG